MPPELEGGWQGRAWEQAAAFPALDLAMWLSLHFRPETGPQSLDLPSPSSHTDRGVRKCAHWACCYESKREIA